MRASVRASNRPSVGKAATSKSFLLSSKQSMAYRVKITPRAQRDLFDLYHRIGARSSTPALNWYRGSWHAIRSLRDNPNRCPVTPENEHFRHLIYGAKPHIVV